MATVPTSISAGARGIVHELSGYVVLNYNIDETPVYQQYPDQTGAIADEQKYDTRYDLTMQCYSASSTRTAPTIAAGQLFTFASAIWKLDKISEAGVYNDTLKWNITAHRFENFPSQA